MRLTRLALLLALLLCPLALMAQERIGAIEVNPFVGDFSQISGDRIPGANLWGFNLGYMMNDRFTLEANFTKLANEGENGDIYGLRALYHFQPSHKVVPFVFAGLGQISFLDEKDMLGEIGAGVKYSLNDTFGLRADVKEVFSGADYFKNSLAFTVGLTLQFGGTPRPPVVVELSPDSDGDGVRDSIDYCWNTPPSNSHWKMVVDNRGCPLDEDKNGVPDYKDDADGDHVINYDDACPGTPRGWPVDKMGCPLDSDGDGIPDGREMEIGTDPTKADTDGDKLSDREEIEKYHTDPLKADTDGDGLSDYDEIFVYHTDPLKADTDGDGYKDGEEVLSYKSDPNVAGDVIAQLFGEKAVFFNLNRPEIRKDAGPVLDDVAAFLSKYGTAKLHIAGNTCELGSLKHNQKLSEQRADSAKAYLVKKGIPADRITTEGLGKTKPKYDNKTNGGRQKNRRDDMTVK